MKKRQKFRLDLIGDVIEKTAELTLDDEGRIRKTHILKKVAVDFLIDVVNLVLAIRSQEVIFSLSKRSGFFMDYTDIQGNPLAHKLKVMLMVNVDETFRELEGAEFNPLVNVFLKSRERMRLNYYLDGLSETNRDSFYKVVEALERFSQRLKDDRKPSLVVQSNNFQRSSRKKYQEALSYFKSLSKLYQSLTVVRCDLLYLRGGLSPSPDRPALQLQKDRDEFIKQFRKTIDLHLDKGDLVGYMWCLSYTKSRNFYPHYYHFMLFFRSRHEIRKYTFLVDQVWKQVSDGWGMVYTEREDSSRGIGTGLVKLKNKKSIDQVRRAIFYMTMTDYFVKIKVPIGDKFLNSYGRASLPKSAKKINDIVNFHLTVPMDITIDNEWTRAFSSEDLYVNDWAKKVVFMQKSSS
ncbi:hypothetical protein ACBP46_02750 [Paenalcaligenes hominis]|uniref:hypothetical protein n=1 Tax=Paenalcaligenes hominis TaxID=643674 RepID=UPI003524347D